MPAPMPASANGTATSISEVVTVVRDSRANPSTIIPRPTMAGPLGPNRSPSQPAKAAQAHIESTKGPSAKTTSSTSASKVAADWAKRLKK